MIIYRKKTRGKLTIFDKKLLIGDVNYGKLLEHSVFIMILFGKLIAKNLQWI